MSTQDVSSDEPLVQRAYMPEEWIGRLIPTSNKAVKRVPPDIKTLVDRPRPKRKTAQRPRLAKFINVKIKKWVD